MQVKAQYNPSSQKITECILTVASMSKQYECNFIFCVLFFSDVIHIQKYGRPITGDAYIKTSNGVFPKVAYGLMHNKFGVFDQRDIPFQVRNPFQDPCYLSINREPNFDFLSKTDIDCLEFSVSFSLAWSLHDLTHMIKEQPAWMLTNYGKAINYLDLVDVNSPDAEQIQNCIQETAGTLVF